MNLVIIARRPLGRRGDLVKSMSYTGLLRRLTPRNDKNEVHATASFLEKNTCAEFYVLSSSCNIYHCDLRRGENSYARPPRARTATHVQHRTTPEVVES